MQNLTLLPQLPPVGRDCGKHTYQSLKDARTAINHRTHGHQRKRPAQLRPYFCHRCDGWHLSHKPDLFT